MTHPISAKLPREIASKILDRAASLDATDERIDLETPRLNFYEASLKATIAGVIGGTMAITVVSVVFSDIGPLQLLPGAIVGGIGILTGALSYFKNKLKG